MAASALLVVLVGSLVCVPVHALAQATVAPSAAPSAAPPADAPSEPSRPKPPGSSFTGYAGAESALTGARKSAVDRPKRRTVAHPTGNPHGPVALRPGFEMLPDGGSRVFVELTGRVEIEEQGQPARLVYRLKGAQVARRNNENALVTVYFNTPVARVRLVPTRDEVRLVIELRADAVPSWQLEGHDAGAALSVVFPKGEYAKLAPPVASRAEVPGEWPRSDPRDAPPRRPRP